MTNHKVISVRNDKQKFQQELDRISKEYNVFATQTHVTSCDGCLYFSAVCFIKD